MKYLGSKNRMAKYLVPVIQSYITDNTKGYLEPFVGGANVIDKIQCSNKIGYDINYNLIELLKHVQKTTDDIPEYITEEEYNNVKNNKDKYEAWYVGLVGFCATFGAKYFGGYARDRQTGRNIPKEGINNLKKQSKYLSNIHFDCIDFQAIQCEDFNNFVIYCDIPYRNTTKYVTKKFPYEYFYEWVKKMSKNNTVLISEYNMPDDFECIWQYKIKDNLSYSDKIEKLYIYKY